MTGTISILSAETGRSCKQGLDVLKTGSHSKLENNGGHSMDVARAVFFCLFFLSELDKQCLWAVSQIGMCNISYGYHSHWRVRLRVTCIYVVNLLMFKLLLKSLVLTTHGRLVLASLGKKTEEHGQEQDL